VGTKVKSRPIIGDGDCDGDYALFNYFVIVCRGPPYDLRSPLV
jgi:hypothetical protein